MLGESLKHDSSSRDEVLVYYCTRTPATKTQLFDLHLSPVLPTFPPGSHVLSSILLIKVIFSLASSLRQLLAWFMCITNGGRAESSTYHFEPHIPILGQNDFHLQAPHSISSFPLTVEAAVLD